MPSVGLTVRIMTLMAAAVFFAAAAAIGAWTHDHQQRRDAALVAQADLMLRELETAIGVRLTLAGLPLAELPDVDPLLDVVSQRLENVRSLAVLDVQGRGLFSSNLVEIGESMLDSSLLENVGVLRVADDRLLWRPITTEYGTVAGFILLWISDAGTRRDVAGFALMLITRAAPILALLGLFAAAFGYLLAYWVGRETDVALAFLLAQSEDSQDSKPVLVATHDESGSPLGLPITQFVDNVNQRQRRLSDLEQELGKLDEMA
jgi:hypothetical protein